jgi:hypothetical protein
MSIHYKTISMHPYSLPTIPRPQISFIYFGVACTIDPSVNSKIQISPSKTRFCNLVEFPMTKTIPNSIFPHLKTRIYEILLV